MGFFIVCILVVFFMGAAAPVPHRTGMLAVKRVVVKTVIAGAVTMNSREIQETTVTAARDTKVMKDMTVKTAAIQTQTRIDRR